MDVTRVRLRIDGTVQGVGFRPFVHRLATGLGLGGTVGNDANGVVVEVEGTRGRVEQFLARLPVELPPLAHIDDVQVESLPPRGVARFVIAASETAGNRQVLVSPDVACCLDCLAELRDPADRRYRYPFVNCTNCGPRYTIVRDVPYDRPFTTMAGFEMCAPCKAEYHDPSNRRFHAQPTCCPDCGPQMRLVDADGHTIAGEPIAATTDLLRAGGIVAVKGLGGYHLAVDAGNEDAASTLRARKYREDKPFAVMVHDLAAARALCEVSEAEADLLASTAAPIVLLDRKPDIPVADAVAPGNRSLGVMLPYTPLHHLLLAEHGGPIVLTSGNVSDEPIAYEDGDARRRLSGIADAYLTHDRPIHMRVDDSVERVLAGAAVPLRRSRGYAPRPLPVPWPFPRHTLAVGAGLKNTVCLAKGSRAFVSHHIGDLENYEAYRSFAHAIDHVALLFDVVPEVVAYDLHPEYLSTRHALDLPDVDLVGVQHHHAHIASCLADNGEAGPVIGVAFDGTGFGTDGTIWGGEVLVADLVDFDRAGCFAPVPLPGGEAAIREPWRMAAAYLDAAFDGEPPAGIAVVGRNADRWAAVRAVAASGSNSPMTSSAGRLFDAVAAVIDVRDAVNYEGQAAVELEQLAEPTHHGGYVTGVREGAPFLLDGPGLFRAVVEDRLAGTDASVVAARFHDAVVDLIVAACRRVRDETALDTVALSGGVFQNAWLVDRAVAALEAWGLRVLTHHRVPPNDGGISFGQAVVAAARDRHR